MTREEIENRIKEIRNEFNEESLDDATIEYYSLFIYQNKNGVERSIKDKKEFLYITLHDYSRILVKEYPRSITVVKNKGDRYYIYIKNNNRVHQFMDFFVGGTHKERLESMVHKTAYSLSKILEQGFVETKIEFPTGNVIFSNFFKSQDGNSYAFEVPDHLKHNQINSINHSLGEQNVMGILSETHGLGYVQLGNTTATVYKVSNDKIVITNSYNCYYDEEKDEEIDIPIDSNWEELGSIGCDVWRIEFIDQENFDKGITLPLDHSGYHYNQPFIGKVNPGIWNIKNYYSFIDDDKIFKHGNMPIWVEMERVVQK